MKIQYRQKEMYHASNSIGFLLEILEVIERRREKSIVLSAIGSD